MRVPDADECGCEVVLDPIGPNRKHCSTCQCDTRPTTESEA